jgi:hypothetical protein
LRTVARVAVVAGAIGSVGIMLRVGHRNGASIPVILVIFFTIWVLSPFAALVLADILSRRWSVPIGATLTRVMLSVTLGSLAIYGGVALNPPRPKPASVFLMVPFGAWLLMTVVAIAAFGSDRRSRRGAGS